MRSEMSDENEPTNDTNSQKSWWKSRSKELFFLSGIAGMSVVMGFGGTLALTKKQDPNMFNKGIIPSKSLPESGGALAMRALGRGTLYAVSGVTLISVVVWKLMGVHSMEEFTAKTRGAMPKFPKKEPTGKSDFKTVRELVHYVLDEDEKDKRKKS